MREKLTWIAAMVALVTLMMAASMAPAVEGRVGVFRPGQSAWPPETGAGLVDRLKARGCTILGLTDRDLAEPGRLEPDALDLLLLCDGTRVPVRALRPLADYVARGGKMMILGGPFFADVTWPYGDQWLDRPALMDRLGQDLRPTILMDFESPQLEGWRHNSSNPRSVSTARRVGPGAEGSQGAMLLELVDVAGWETFIAGGLDRPFPPGHAWTTFCAKGESDQGPIPLMVEWQERDGSRWIAVVQLTGRWQFYTLPPEAFGWWQDPPVPGRGHPGDVLQPRQAVALTLGLAQSHADLASPRGRYRIWIDRVGTVAPPAGLEDVQGMLISRLAMPVIETVSPAYKLYPVSSSDRVRVNPGQAIAGRFEVPKIAGTMAPHPRSLGTGLDKKRRWRFVPLVECLDKEGRVAGAAASLLIRGVKPAEAGLVAAVPVTDPAFFAPAATQEWLADLVTRMLDGVFLYEGGARYYASFGGETMPVGALVANRGRMPARVTVRAVVRRSDGRVLWERAWPIEIPAGDARRVEAPWPIPADAPDRMVVTVTLCREERPGATGGLSTDANPALAGKQPVPPPTLAGKQPVPPEIDRLEHQVRIWRPKPKPQFMTVRAGGFYLGETPWYAHGVNYMPSSGIACEDFFYFDHWLGAEPYDPEAIDRDLARLKAVGLNVVSVFIDHSSLGARNLRDFLLRCEDHGLKVNLSLRPGTPMDFPWEKMREIIVTERLAASDTVIAYDLAWEPTWGRRQQRRRYDRLWREWIKRRYQGIEAAEQAWGCRLPREDGQPAGPGDEQLSGDGPHRAMTLDYRRFLDDLLTERYGKARDLVRSIDPNHPVSFRMSTAGDPTVPPATMPYDLAGLARAVDVMEPEGYGRVGDWKAVRPGWFTVAYARAVAPELPVLWAEFGTSVWSQSEGRASTERLAFAERFYDDFYQMAYRSGSDGTIAWFSSGGYRVDEKSDFGILNPDGSWRPQTRVIHRWSERMTRPRPVPKPDVWIPIRLYRDADGLAGIYRRVEKEFWSAIDAGRRPGLKIVAEGY